MAFSILSLGMFAARAFWIMRRNARVLSGLAPPDFTAIAMSLPIRVKAFAIRSHRLNMVALRVSKMRPMAGMNYHTAGGRAPRGSRPPPGRPRGKRRPAARFAFGGDRAVQGLDALPRDPQAQPEAAVFP